MTDEPMTRRVGTQVCFTTDAAKTIWSPLAADAVVIEDNGVVVDPENYVVKHLGGQVEFIDTYTITGPVTVTGKYLPLLPLATARAATFNMMRISIDVSVLGQDYVDRIPGRGDCNGTCECLEDGGYDHDPGAGLARFEEIVAAGLPILFEYKPNPDSSRVARAWALFEGHEVTSELDSPTTAALAWNGTLPGLAEQSYFFGDPTA